MNENAPIDYAPPDPAARRRRLIKQILLIGLALFVLGLGICGYNINVALKQMGGMHTGTNLRQIGQWIYLYAQDSQGVLPPDFQSLIRTQQISTETFICGNSDDVRAEGVTLEEKLQDFANPGRCSFIYVGAGLAYPLAPNAVLAIDSPAHEDASVMVLWGDGSVAEVPFPMIVQILEDLAAGKNPPSSSTNLTSKQARQIYDKKWRNRIPAMQTGGWRMPSTQNVQ